MQQDDSKFALALEELRQMRREAAARDVLTALVAHAVITMVALWAIACQIADFMRPH